MGDGVNDYDLRNILTNLSVRVGKFEGKIEQFMEQWRQQDTAAGLSRQVTQQRLELLSTQVDRLANDLLHMQQDLAELKNDIDEEVMPVIRLSEFARERKAGARAVMATFWAGLVIVISALAYAADKLVSYLFPRP